MNHDNENDAVTDAETKVAVIADLVAKHIKPRMITAKGPAPDDPEVPVLVLPTSLKIHPLDAIIDAHRERPRRRKGTAQLQELASLIDHVNRFKDADSALFAKADPKAPTLMAVLDYHRRRNVYPSEHAELTTEDLPEPMSNLGEPRFGSHRAVYSFPLSDEWIAWSEQNGKPMGQAEFATWIEDRIIDVANPEHAFNASKAFAEALGVAQFATPQRLLGLSRGLSIHVDERVTSRIDPATGETTMSYEATHNDAAGGSLSVPRAFLIQIPVFRGGIAYQFPVRLKYRTGGGKVVWFYEVHNVARAFADAFREACETAAEKTRLPLFYGSPETP